MRRFLPVIFLFFCILLFFLPVFLGGTFISTGMMYSDLMSFNYPLKDFYRSLLLEGKLPFWTSLLGSGYPLFAEGQIGALYPPHLFLFSFLPTLLAFNLNLFLHFLMAALFTFLFCRISLKLSVMASLLAGLVYSFSGFNLTHLHQVNIIMVISYLPLLLLLIERLVTTRRAVWVFCLALILALQILAGHIEMFYYTAVASGLFFLFLAFLFPERPFLLGEKKSLLFSFALAFILGLGLSAVQLLPTWELTQLSSRSTGLDMEMSLGPAWPIEALKLFVNPKAFDLYLPQPDFHPLNPDSQNFNVLYGYVGLVPLALGILGALGALGKGQKKRFVVIFTIFLAGAFVFALGSSTQLFTILWTVVPGLKFFREPVKILFLIEFCLAVLAALGLDRVRAIKGYQGLSGAIRGILMAGIIGFTFFDLYFNNALRIAPVVSAKDWFTPPPTAAFLEKELKKGSFRYLTTGTGNLDYSLARDYQIQKELQNLLPPNFNLLFKIPSYQEWVVLFLRRQQEFNQVGWGVDYLNKKITTPAKFKKALNLQNVKYLLTHLPIEDQDFVLVKQIPLSRPINHLVFLDDQTGTKRISLPTQSIYIYENRKVLPRAFLVPRAKVTTDKRAGLQALFNQDFDPLKEVIVEEEINFRSQRLAASSQQKVNIIKDGENEIELEVETDVSGFLVLSDTYYPGWKAFVDGQPVKTYQANYAFRAIAVGEGKHLVKFVFEPTHWRLGLAISGLALLGTLGGLGWTIIKLKIKN